MSVDTGVASIKFCQKKQKTKSSSRGSTLKYCKIYEFAKSTSDADWKSAKNRGRILRSCFHSASLLSELRRTLLSCDDVHDLILLLASTLTLTGDTALVSSQPRPRFPPRLSRLLPSALSQRPDGCGYEPTSSAHSSQEGVFAQGVARAWRVALGVGVGVGVTPLAARLQPRKSCCVHGYQRRCLLGTVGLPPTLLTDRQTDRQAEQAEADETHFHTA